MFNNSYITERMINDKLEALRSEGMRSQMLARAGLQNQKKVHLPDLRGLLHRLFKRETNQSLPQIENPAPGIHWHIKA